MCMHSPAPHTLARISAGSEADHGVRGRYKWRHMHGCMGPFGHWQLASVNFSAGCWHCCSGGSSVCSYGAGSRMIN